MSKVLKQARFSQQGSALVYILIAIALLAALTMSFMQPSNQQTSSQNTFKSLSALQGQADMIRSGIQECVLSYPKGDSAIDNSGGGSDPGARKNYPINPNSNYYPAPDRSGDRLVKNIRCPGNNPGGADVDEHEHLFSSNSGKYLPPPPDLFDDWQYYNGDDGVFFWISTGKSDAFIQSSLEKLDEKFGECEADIVTGGEDLDSDGDVACPADNLCFRVRMITNASAVWNGTLNTDEDSGC